MSKTEQNINTIWLEFKSEQTVELKHKLIMRYIWLVKYVLQQMSLPNNTILDENDFLSIGILGLNESIDRFEYDRGIKFESYAIPRIRGVIQDELRKLDWLSRSARKKVNDYIIAGDSLRSSEGREVSLEEIRQKLDITQEKYNTYLAAAAAAKASMSMMETQVNIDSEDMDIWETISDSSQENFLEQIENEERINFIMNYLKILNEKKRRVITLYYFESLTFKDIGVLLNISESRVCQIHTQIVGDLRIKLTEFDNA